MTSSPTDKQRLTLSSKVSSLTLGLKNSLMSLVLRSRGEDEVLGTLDSSIDLLDVCEGPSAKTRPPCRGEIDIFNIVYLIIK